MFEDRTYENLLDEALALITDDVDKQEGSVIRTAISPCIYKLAETYILLDNFIDIVTGDTATGEYLDRVVKDYGIVRKSATYSIRKVTTTVPVTIGTRWSLNDTTYKITELMETNVYKAMCEQTGTIGNTYSGALEPIDFVGEVVATLTDIITPGEEIETDDNLRSRFYAQVQAPSTSGNNEHYKKWALEVPGCGNAKVFPLWNGNGTVKILVVDENMAIDSTLPTTVATYIETVRPIGATVTVESPISKTISVTANVVLDGTKLLSDVQGAFTSALSSYLKEIVFDSYSVSYAKVGSLLFATDGVSDYNTMLINGATSNVSLASTEMPIIGTITLTEVV